MSWVNKVLAPVLENVNGLTFLWGAGSAYLGVWHFSPAVAHILAGVILMAIGAFPYLVRLRKRKA